MILNLNAQIIWVFVDLLIRGRVADTETGADAGQNCDSRTNCNTHFL